jgi:hypothetical protein
VAVGGSEGLPGPGPLRPQKRTGPGPVARAGLHAVGRRLQPGAHRRHGLRPPPRALRAFAPGRRWPRRVRRRKEGGEALAGAVVGVRASVGVRARVTELARPRPRRLGARLLRNQLRLSGARQGDRSQWFISTKSSELKLRASLTESGDQRVELTRL